MYAIAVLHRSFRESSAAAPFLIRADGPLCHGVRRVGEDEIAEGKELFRCFRERHGLEDRRVARRACVSHTEVYYAKSSGEIHDLYSKYKVRIEQKGTSA